jgi:hypothetical protein
MSFRYVDPLDASLRLPEPPRVGFTLGFDLGQSQDFTALNIIRSTYADGAEPLHQLVYLDRFKLGVSYVAVADAVVRLTKRPELGSEWRLVVDATGLGRPVCDLLRKALGDDARRLVAATITGSGKPSWKTVGASLPKHELVSNLLILLETGRLSIASGVAELDAFLTEAKSFQVQITKAGNDTYNAQEGFHDDLVMSVSLSSWVAERRGPRRIRVSSWVTPSPFYR